MSDINPEFEEYPTLQTSIIPDFNQVLTQKLQKSTGFDPHALMVKKKEVDSGEVAVDTTPKQEWPEKDIKALEDFCNKYGVMGFNCGKMSPVAAIAMLKNMMGVVDAPMAERVPIGYEKLGVKSPIYNQKYSYTTMIKQKTSQKSLLKG